MTMTLSGQAVIKLSAPGTGQFWQVPILWEDARLLALDKPAGLLTSPARDNPQQPNLITLLHQGVARGAPWAKERELHYLAHANRLDFETSGVILLAKDKAALIALANQFGAEQPNKLYLALACGAPTQDTFTINAKLAADPVRIGLVRVDSRQGRKAITRIEVAERFAGYVLLICRPITDRPHQMRAHLRHARLAIVGDTRYGGAPLFLSQLKSDYRFKRTEAERPLIAWIALHLEQVTFDHPLTQARQTIRAPWPKDLRVAAKYLRQYAPGGSLAS